MAYIDSQGNLQSSPPPGSSAIFRLTKLLFVPFLLIFSLNLASTHYYPSVEADFRSSISYLAALQQLPPLSSSSHTSRSCFGICLRVAGAKTLFVRVLPFSTYYDISPRNDLLLAPPPPNANLLASFAMHSSLLAQADVALNDHLLPYFFPSPTSLANIFMLAASSLFLLSFLHPTLPSLLSFSIPHPPTLLSSSHALVTSVLHPLVYHPHPLSVFAISRDFLLLQPLMTFTLSNFERERSFLGFVEQTATRDYVLYLWTSLLLSLGLLATVTPRMNVNGPDLLLGVLHGFIMYSCPSSPVPITLESDSYFVEIGPLLAVVVVSRVVFEWDDWDGVVKRIAAGVAGGCAAAHAFQSFGF